jgi:3-oxochol-4-en-24-oyl-CoA dehydrogenase
VTAEQIALGDAVRGFAQHAKLRAEARAFADAADDALPASWPAIAAQELPALPLDGELLDVCIAVDALGHALAAGPVVPTMLAALLAREHGDEELRRVVDSGARDGSFSAAVCVNGLLVGGAAVSTAVLPVGTDWYAVDAAAAALTSTPGI